MSHQCGPVYGLGQKRHVSGGEPRTAATGNHGPDDVAVNVMRYLDTLATVTKIEATADPSARQP